ncbi:MAG TPA: sigma-70 family RNA polymerase sigma factor [Acidimicrobiia bacterium]|nr:sigma-70 family RNA polymerase sigma factor [Acidimicrobiia bacterium]
MDELTRLFLAARDGDRMALTEAIRASEADVWRFVAHLVGPNEADDVTQDTYVRAWRALPEYRADAGARTWLLSISRRAAADAIRRNQRRRRLAERARAEAAAAPLPSDPNGRWPLDELLAALDPDQRAAFVLTQVLGYSYAETAEICGVRIGTVRSRIARARADLVDRVRAADAG